MIVEFVKQNLGQQARQNILDLLASGWVPASWIFTYLNIGVIV